MIQFPWVIDDFDWHYEPIVDAAVGNFDAVAFPSSQKSEVTERKLKRAIQLAKERGLYVYLWLKPGQWKWWHPDLTASWPADWNLKSWVPGVPTCEKFDMDWPNFSKSEVRDWITEHLVIETRKYLSRGLDGVLYDHTRYPAKAWIVPKQVVTADDVTQLARQTSEAMRSLGLNILASPIDARMKDLPDDLPLGGNIPRYQVLGQDWPVWLREKIVDLVYVMTYCGPSGLPTQWEGVPADVRDQTISLLKMGSGIFSEQDVRDAHRVVTERLDGVGVSAFVPHPEFRSIVDSGILSVFPELPDTPIPEPPDGDDEPPPVGDDEPDLAAIARELNAVAELLAEIAQELE